jgi:hypothetical protein
MSKSVVRALFFSNPMAAPIAPSADVPPVRQTPPTSAAAPAARRTHARRAGLRPVGSLLLLAVLAYATVLRTWDLGSRPFWVDEAESCINALTILEHGLPIDHYLGLPIHENTLTRPWPQSPEYEFQDTSYSRKGLAIYHGWLPLYSIATAFAAAGVAPDRDASNLAVKHSPQEMRLRTVVGRSPSVIFGVAFLVLAFLAAREMYGADAGWVALVAGAVCTPAIEFARQARYYAPTLALTTFCCLMIWRMLRRGAWRDFVVGAVAFGLLFHAHMLSFFVACAACSLLIPFMLRHPRALPKTIVTGSIVALMVFPWAVLSGFLGTTSDIPSARTLLVFPDDYLAYPLRQWVYILLALVALAWLFLAPRLRHRLPPRLLRPFSSSAHRAAFFFLAAWAAIGLVSFLLLMPAASFFYKRLTLMLMGPGLLFGAMLFAAIGRVAAGRVRVLGRGRSRVGVSAAAGTALFLLCLAAYGRVTLWYPALRPQAYTTYQVVELLRTRSPFRPGTRLYATPNYHLPMTFYTGIPVGNVAAVRKAFLDTCPGELVILEAGPYYDWLTWQEIRAEAARHGFTYSDDEMWAVESMINTRLVRQALAGKVGGVWPPLEPALPYYDALLERQRQKTRTGIDGWINADGNPMLWGYPIERYSDWWPVFFYRFVGVEQRSGPNLNYAARVRDGHATVTPYGWTIYHCPARPAPSAQPTNPAAIEPVGR